MKVSYREGGSAPTLAPSHASATERLRRSVDRGNRRPGIELRNQARPGCRRCRAVRKAKPKLALKREPVEGPAQSETLSMWGSFLHGNRENPGVPCQGGAQGRSRKATNRNLDVHASGKSDDCIVPKKPSNKVVRSSERLAMEDPKRARR